MSDWTFPTNCGSGRTWETTCFGVVATVSTTAFRGARREAGSRRPATALRTIMTGNRRAEAVRGVRGATAGRRGARADLFSRSQRAVDARASAITRAVVMTNASAIRVSDNTASPPPMRPRVFRLPVVRSSVPTIPPTGRGSKDIGCGEPNRYGATAQRVPRRRRRRLSTLIDDRAAPDVPRPRRGGLTTTPGPATRRDPHVGDAPNRRAKTIVVHKSSCTRPGERGAPEESPRAPLADSMGLTELPRKRCPRRTPAADLGLAPLRWR
jgi:hypothetical protein